MSNPLSQVSLGGRAAALGERLAAGRPESWRPDEPESGHPNPLIGTLLRAEHGETSWGRKRILVLRDERDHEWSVWVLHQVLENELARLAPQPGEVVAVRFDGLQTPKGGGKPYRKFSVLVDRDGSTIDWGAGQDERQPAPFAGGLGESGAGECGRLHPDHAPGCGADVPF